MKKIVHYSDSELLSVLNGMPVLVDVMELPEKDAKVLLLEVRSDVYTLVIQGGIYPDCEYTPV